jgi:glutaredoxin
MRLLYRIETSLTISPAQSIIVSSRYYYPTEVIAMSKAVFYHAGCPVCVSAERGVAEALDPERYDVEVVHLGQEKERIPEAEAAGVKSVPALVMNGQTYHINFGAAISDLK